ncbi:MAG: outer membrane lipid asymmetry maintenance protein MlaD [Phaeovulum sp.]|jgi:phospholipid/cholesterol/gamma-HCH transport system substrate-binding protein|uniref:outer membrane lipid asymmetry maintenance protein MlaD n=1 Tax=Phaeovulum sp. TaxID=2934796 RepID=UPI0027318351|nr:outer membrane lipid asymmetry maintenance protein MlaD [Phaeovulum sp.]MDP2063042.1 outer membrane lipid asymmetry maintenance protein MlaD [Phaeovulum sp.]
MAENRTEVLAGAAVMLIALGFFFWAAQGSSFAPKRGGYEVRASFRSVEGITVGSDVRLAGVKIGTVTNLALNPVTFFADARIAINEGVVLPADSGMLVASEGLLGGAFVEVMPGGAIENLAPGAEIEDTQGAVSLLNLLLKFVGGGSAAPAAETAP